MLKRYSFQESLNRILRAIKGNPPSDDSELSGGLASWDEAASYIAEVMQGSYPGVTGTIPSFINILSGSYMDSHAEMHRKGIGLERLGGSSSHVLIGSDGTVMLIGDATTFTDFSVPATLVKRGANDKPDYDYTNVGLLFPQNDSAEKVYLTVQFPHDKKLDSAVYPHIHYIQAGTGTPTFVYSYRWYNNGSHPPTVWLTGTTSAGTKGLFTWVSGSMLQIGAFPAITPPMLTEGTSSNIDMIIFREDNDISGDVLVKFIDVHYEIDSFGSSSQYTK